MSLFKALETNFRGQLDALTVLVVFNKDGEMTVNVTPKVSDAAKEKSPHLANPFQVKATAADLDEGFAEALAPMASARATLAEQAKAQVDALKANAANKTAGKGVAKPGAPAPKASGNVSFEGDDNDGEGSTQSGEIAEAPAAAPAPAPAASTADALFTDD